METLDKTDLRILKVLQNQARITNQDLADKIHLSPSSCLMRVRKLEQAGILESYHASVNLKKICRIVKCLVTISMKNQTKKDFLQFQQYVENVPEVLECYTVSGAFDFFLKVAAPNMERYLELTDQLIECTEAEIHLSTHVVMDENKVSKGYPLDQLL
jgi:Lrp/AsnC family transcriptional regulator of ectoine degradation